MHYGLMKIIVKSMYFLIKNIFHYVQRLLSDDTQIFQTINHQHMFIYIKKVHKYISKYEYDISIEI